MIGDYCVSIFLQRTCVVDGKHLKELESETSIFKFPSLA